MSDPDSAGGYRSFADREQLSFLRTNGRTRSERVPVGLWHAAQEDADETLCGIDLYRVSEFERGKFEGARAWEGSGPPSGLTMGQWRCPECDALADQD